MRFILHYQGPLKSNGSLEHKHRIRTHFHSQLKTLWRCPPLNGHPNLLSPRTEGRASSLRNVGPHTFAPVVTEELRLVAEVGVTMLRPQAPGGLITQGGDIDNRLKTLFDALRMPKEGELPKDFQPPPEGEPFLCVLEDDSQIIAVSVRAEQLLDSSINQSDVILLLAVETKALAALWGNAGLG